MTDFNAEFHRCCGYEVEIPGYEVKLPDGQMGRRVRCPLCEKLLDLPGDMEAVRKAIPAHFRDVHQLLGQLEDFHP